MTPQEFRTLNKGMTTDELNNYKYERFTFLALCIVCLVVSIVIIVFSVLHDHISLASLIELGSAGILGVSVYSLLLFVTKTRKYVRENIELFLKATPDEAA